MTTITYCKGDATRPTGEGPKVIVHVCNDLGLWGKGFVVALGRAYPLAESEYRYWHGCDSFKLGRVQCVEVAPALWVANMIAQHGVNNKRGLPPIRYAALSRCLGRVAEFCLQHGASMHAPRFGAGLAGGNWDREIVPIIKTQLLSRDIPVTIYLL